MAAPVVTPAAVTVQCGTDQFNLDGKQCCTKCPPGSGIVSPCNATSDTVCKPCIYSQTYSLSLSHTDGCLRCSSCPKNAHPVRSCTVTHDTKCQCQGSSFYDQVTRTCRPCSYCPVGWGAKEMCTGTQDTKCTQCPTGTYSDRSSLQGCRVCRTCGANQVRLQKCSAAQDTVCVDIPVYSTQPSYNLLTKKGEKGDYSEHGTELIPLYCAIMGSIVVGLLVYVIVKHLRRKAPDGSKRCHSHSAMLESEYSKKNGSIADSGVFLEPDLKIVSSKLRIRDLPPVKRKAIEECFSAATGYPGSWDQLARELGYNKSRIASIELRAEQDCQPAIRYLLLEWGKSENATVGVLIRALKRIQRQDVARVILSEGGGSLHRPCTTTYLHKHTHSVILNVGPSGPDMV